VRGLAALLFISGVLGCSRPAMNAPMPKSETRPAVAAVPAPTGEGRSEPRSRPEALGEIITRLHEAQILDDGAGAELRGDEIASHAEAAAVAARLIAYGSVRLVEQDPKTPLDEHIRQYVAGLGEPPTLPGISPDNPGYVYMAYVDIATPDGAGDPLALCEGLTRAELARVASAVLGRIIEAHGSDLVKLVPPEDEAPDYDFGDEGEPAPEAQPGTRET